MACHMCACVYQVITAMKARGLQVPKQYEKQSPDGAVSPKSTSSWLTFCSHIY